jgi:hypothetical protein
MGMNELIIISVDDHITEPGDMFDRHLTGEAAHQSRWHQFLGISGQGDPLGWAQRRRRAPA